ncbi:MAG: helix-turn-helix transcriptional regulator [Pseudomonadota bacterium]
MSDTVPFSSFSTDAVNPKYRRDAWIESMKPLYDVAPIEMNSENFNAGLQGWKVGDLFFGLTTHDSQIIDRQRSEHNRSKQNDFLMMLIYREGSAKSIHDGKPTEHYPNDVHLLDFSRNHRSVALNSRVEWVLAPYERVGFDPDNHPANIVLPADTTAGRVLNALSTLIFEKLPSAEMKDAKVMAAMLTGAIRSLINGDTGEVLKEQAISGRRRMMQQFVIENIHDLNLDVTTLCEKFGVSRATVFRDFEPGGLQRFMMLHRLNCALKDIAYGPAIRGRIALIAEKWGFSSPAHFSRAFREHFGFSPSDAVGVGRNTGLASPHEIGIDNQWMRWATKATANSSQAA